MIQLKSMKNSTGVYIFLIVLTVAVLAGFYVIFRQLNVIQQVVLNVPGNVQPAATSTATSTPGNQTPSSTPISTPPEGAAGAVSIPTGIIFTVLSSPVLQPQANVTVTITSVAQASDGTVTVSLKAYTNQATSYSALNPSDFLQIVNLSGNNDTVVSTTGNWNSMPPQGVTTGTAVFKAAPNANPVILQVGAPSSADYYQFDFTTQSYKQTVLG
jgi:hypothetical protein